MVVEMTCKRCGISVQFDGRRALDEFKAWDEGHSARCSPPQDHNWAPNNGIIGHGWTCTRCYATATLHPQTVGVCRGSV